MFFYDIKLLDLKKGKKTESIEFVKKNAVYYDNKYSVVGKFKLSINLFYSVYLVFFFQ